MQKFLVGGAVRDTLMGLQPKDKDYVVVGPSVNEMLDAGFEKVGADFPVFLHPETGDECALARSERSTGDGYLDFETSIGEAVTTRDGRVLTSINPYLLQKFLGAGFDSDTDYDLDELIQFFHSF